MPVDKSTLMIVLLKSNILVYQINIRVVASFYPIFDFVKKVGGDRVEVSSLIPVGIEPHDFEPTIQQA